MSNSFRHLFKTYGGDSGSFKLGGGGRDENEDAHDEVSERADRKKGSAQIEELKPQDEKTSRRKRRRSLHDGEDAGHNGTTVDVNVSSTTPALKSRSARKSNAEKVDRRIEPDPDYKTLSRKFVRAKSLEEVEEQWQAEKKEIWLNFKSRRRDFLRGRKHGSTRASTK
mmetsp:Transcript_23616/g.93282  ORF Transcript_23616/g.93282 Transcript_23616/m.93282 type:complete len:168 (+) Transcript_23616:187-690(+)